MPIFMLRLSMDDLSRVFVTCMVSFYFTCGHYACDLLFKLSYFNSFLGPYINSCGHYACDLLTDDAMTL